MWTDELSKKLRWGRGKWRTQGRVADRHRGRKGELEGGRRKMRFSKLAKR